MTPRAMPHLSWNEVRDRAIRFSREHAGDRSESAERDTNLDGDSLFRTEERICAERRYLKSKWKAHICFEEYKSQDRVSISVDRKQALAAF